MAAIAVNCYDVCLLLEKRGVWPECEDEALVDQPLDLSNEKDPR